jgi:hypothetical protein
MRKVFLAVTASASALVAHAVAAQGPAIATSMQAPPTIIIYSSKGPNGLSDLPLGVHHIPDSNVIISGHQKGGGLGVAFGPLGLLAQSSANAESGAVKVGEVQDDLRFDVAAKAVELTRTILADEKYRQLFTLSAKAGGGTLTVVPYVVVTFENETDVRPYIVLKTKISAGSPSESTKSIKYFCCEGKPLPLSGEHGAAQNDGAAMKELMTSELETAIRVMLIDNSEHYLRDKQKKISVNGFLPFAGKPMKVNGYDLGRYDNYVLIEFPQGALVFGGVNIADPASLEIKSVNEK